MWLWVDAQEPPGLDVFTKPLRLTRVKILQGWVNFDLICGKIYPATAFMKPSSCNKELPRPSISIAWISKGHLGTKIQLDGREDLLDGKGWGLGPVSRPVRKTGFPSIFTCGEADRSSRGRFILIFCESSNNSIVCGPIWLILRCMVKVGHGYLVFHYFILLLIQMCLPLWASNSYTIYRSRLRQFIGRALVNEPFKLPKS